MRHCYGDITSVGKVKLFPSGREDWAEIISYQDDRNYHLRFNHADDGSCISRYMTPEQVAAHLATYNGIYEEKRSGDESTITIHQNGVLIQTGPLIEGNTTHSKRYQAVDVCLYALVGEEYSGYEHNYEIKDNKVYDEPE